jgi:hypothetical protein
MKTKLVSLILLFILIIPLILTGCGNDNSKPNFGATGAKVYEPSLSAMSDEAIRIKVDESYDRLVNTNGGANLRASIAAVIAVYQNELMLRQLEAMNANNQHAKLTITDAGYWTKGLLRITVGDTGRHSLKGN